MAAISLPHHDDTSSVVAPLLDEQLQGEVVYLPSPFLDVEEIEPRTSPLALGIFGIGLLLAVVLVVTAPLLAALSLVGGIVGGGIVNAPAGEERRRTVAALVLPVAGLGLLTLLFVSSF